MTKLEGMPGDKWLEFQRNAPEREWFIYEVIAPGALTLIGGRPKEGKSFIAYLLAMALVSNRKLGPFVPSKRTRVGYIDLEGVPKKTAERVELLCKGHKVPEKTMEYLQVLDGVNFKLLDGYVEPVIAWIHRFKLEVVFIDTFGVSFGDDENSKQSVQAYLNALKDLRIATGCAIVLVHHTNKAQFAYRETMTPMDADGGLRGSSAIAGAYDVILSLQSGFIEDRFFYVMMSKGKYHEASWTPYEIVGDKDEAGKWTRSEVTFGKRRDGLGFWSKPPENKQPVHKRQKTTTEESKGVEQP